MAVARTMLVVALGLAARAAHGDGAFPDSMAIFAPPDRPHQIVLATNFGLVTTDDDGATWHLVCEQAIASYVSAYQMSAPPDDALFADAPYGLAVSRDGGCTWTFAAGAFAGNEVIDAFPDPTAANHVLAIARQVPDGGVGAYHAVFESTDGGRTFGAAPIFTGSPMTTLTGVENARADPRTIYLTMYGETPFQPLLARSVGGAPFQIIDDTAAPSDIPRIAAVDPIDPRTLYLRTSGTTGDRLAISHDGGDTLALPLALAGRMSAFLRRSSGTLLVGTADTPSFRSTDGGQTFAVWPNAPHVRALAERDGVLYAAGDDLADGFALATSADEGANWRPLLHFDDIAGPLACGNLPSVCGGPWSMLKSLFDAERAAGNPADAATSPPPRTGGCSCQLASARNPSVWLLLPAAGIALMRYRRTRRKRPERLA
ncbi:MAG TPA: MYXO-CTERM sorting domain-containing protein [Polyangia bacterium]|nr:MYXO-CTERM sorting domain-containing protein [Polyangia bacterium]